MCVNGAVAERTWSEKQDERIFQNKRTHVVACAKCKETEKFGDGQTLFLHFPDLPEKDKSPLISCQAAHVKQHKTILAKTAQKPNRAMFRVDFRTCLVLTFTAA